MSDVIECLFIGGPLDGQRIPTMRAHDNFVAHPELPPLCACHEGDAQVSDAPLPTHYTRRTICYGDHTIADPRYVYAPAGWTEHQVLEALSAEGARYGEV